MPLDKQCYIYSVGTDAMYQSVEKEIHKKMNDLRAITYTKDFEKIEKKEINKQLKALKEQMRLELDKVANSDIVRTLSDEELRDKNIISLFESSLTRCCGIDVGELSTKLFQVEFYFYQIMKNLVKNGFNYNGNHYVYFSSSAGSIRKHRGLFIEEELYNKIKFTLTCGLTVDKINQKGGCVINKWLAYLALSSSATTPWEDFDIDRSIVCDDHEIDVFGDMDYIDANDYSITRKYTNVSIPMNDGVGMMLNRKTRVVRGPFIKGLLVEFDFKRFLLEKCKPEQYVVFDIYGTPHNVIKEDIQYIFTKSQFKMAKYYDSWEQYKEYFKKYGCEMSWCNMEQEDAPQARINYQMLNSLSDMTDTEIDKLTHKTVEEIKSIGGDFRTSMRLLGAREQNRNPSKFQMAIMLYPELLMDRYTQEVLKQTKKSYVKQARAGKIRLNSCYRLASPDLYAYCEWLFLGIENPTGLLKNGEVAISQFRDCEEVDCLRSPHLYFEHCLRKNNQSEEVKKWLATKCVYTSCNDLISRVLALDWDGDILFVTNDKTILKVVKRNQKKYIPLLFDMRKANPVEINSENIYNGLVAAFKYGKIGVYSNSCAKIWSSKNIDKDSLTALKLLVAESNWSIDAAKCLYMPTRPESANNLIRQKTNGKLPNYFIYAKDKTDGQVEQANDSTMNRISKSIPDSRLKLTKAIGQFDYTVLLNWEYPTKRDINCDIVYKYIEWAKRQNYALSGIQTLDNLEDVYAVKKAKTELIDAISENTMCIVNTLVWLLYVEKPTWTKKYLWACFGKELLENISVNTKSLGNICPICGKRFKQTKETHIYCSNACRYIANNEMA